MFSGPPLPLLDDLPLAQLVTLTENLTRLGAWVRGREREQRLYLRAPDHSCQVLISEDLGALLRSCRHLAVREGNRPVVLRAQTVIQWRALQVVTSTPYLPGLERLKAQLPALQLTPDGLRVPIRSCSPESVLADCLAHGIQVIGSRIVYDASFTLSSESG